MTLAELAVKLTANTAEFISGFSNAGVATKRFRADLSDHVQAIGGALDGVLSHFGEFGGVLGQTLDGATQAASRAITSFGKLGGTVGTVAGVGAGAAAALLAIEGGAIALAIHTAETAAKLGEMSEKAGVSTQSLAGLALAGKGVGVETESLVKALGFMESNAVKSAIATNYQSTAFGRLNIDVKTATGAMKDGGQLFLETVGKIASLPTPEQAYFVKAIFGRGGIEILPLINEGVDKVREKMELASKFGLGDPATIAASRQFKETIDEIGAAVEGMTLRLTKDLLPSLLSISAQIEDSFKTGKAQGFIDFLAEVVKYTLAAGAAIADLSKATSNLGFAGTAKLFENTVKGFSAGGFSGGLDAVKKHFSTIGSGFSDAVKDFHDITNPAALPPPPPLKTSSPFQPDLAKEDTSLVRIKARIDALSQEASNWKIVASAGTEAEQLIAEAIKKGDVEFGKLLAEAAKSPAATSLVIKDEGLIKASAAAAVFGGEVKKVVGDLDKATRKFDENSRAADAIAAAYEKGGAAIAAAAIEKKLEPERLEVQRLAAEYAIAKTKQDEYLASRAKLGTAAGPVQGENVDPSILKAGLEAATADYEKARAAAVSAASSELSAALRIQAADFSALKPKVDALNQSYAVSQDAVRKATIALELQKFATDELDKGVVVSAQQLDAKRKLLEESDREAYQGALAQEAAQFSLNAQYDSQITKLQRVREILQQNGQSTLLIDARLHEAQDALLHQWDEAAFKVGNFSAKFKGVMGELVIQGRAAGQAISQAFLGAIDGIETNLAKLLTGQKTNFKQVAQGLAEQVTKAEIQKGVGSLAGKFGLNIPGLTGKPDGSSESLALWVKTVGAAGTPSVGSVGNLLSSFRSGSGGDSGGGFFSKLLSSFGGFKAGGGDMSPGSWYVAGEKGPEIVQGPGSVIPNHALGGRTTNITHNHNYPNATSRDLFGRTQQQNQARQLRNSRMAYGF